MATKRAFRLSREPEAGNMRRPARRAGRACVVCFAAAIAAAPLLAIPAPAGAQPPAPVIDSAHVMAQAHGSVGFLAPRAIAFDTTHGEIVVANTGRSRIEFYDTRTWPRGFFVHRVSDSTGTLVEGSPVAVAVDLAGRILVSDLRVAYVSVLDYRGRPCARLTLPPPDDRTAGGQGAGAIAVAPDGRLLVASRSPAGRVHVFGPDYRYQRTWGEPGEEPGQLSVIAALAVNGNGQVGVACVRTHFAVQLFDLEGTLVRGFGLHEIGPGNFSLPSGLAWTADGRWWVSDAIRQVLQVFGSDGAFLGAVGGVGVEPGQFSEPSALASDGHGRLALAEKAGARFQVMWVR